ncbi:hypothetical protein Y032_0013g2034 [Ancylostoma ceylanicum]|uniref:Uncharacterized protein n=1 Tax=Ancylostoma ceylanicum TaxID=53326 RepID=A0A016VBM1_9BILA|nr:hypothetical protein Y032_0013g2034 [Ancylostoma ceylanicum]
MVFIESLTNDEPTRFSGDHGSLWYRMESDFDSDLSLTGAETVMDAENVEDVGRNDGEARAGDEEADPTCREVH